VSVTSNCNQRINVPSRKVTDMRKLVGKANALIVFVGLIGILACGSALSSAHAPAAAITIVNNSSREIRAVYLSPDQNNWGPDLLGSSVIAAGGGSVTITANCSGSSVRVIAEDHEGCFFYTTASCSSDSTWTITNSTAPDCGSE
jgi:hypothetical protein